MATICLTQGLKSVVDNCEVERLSAWRWHAIIKNNSYYAARTVVVGKRPNRQFKKIYMHNEVLPKKKNLLADHVDRDGLNNRRSNLRYATKSENGHNRGLNENNTSGHRGVYWMKQQHKWGALITINRTRYFLGSFDRKEDAVKRRLKAEQ